MDETPSWMQPRGPGWSRANERLAFDNPWISLRTYDATAPTGRATPYGLVHMKNRAIGVLPIFDDGSVMLVGQHRFTFDAYSWEIPEGGGALDEDPVEAARRELREEAGLEAADLRQVMAFDVSNSVTDEQGFGYIATGLTSAEAEPDETEDLATARVPFRQAFDLAMKGAIRDLITVAMLLRAYHMAQEGELSPAMAAAMLAGATNGRGRPANDRTAF